MPDNGTNGNGVQAGELTEDEKNKVIDSFIADMIGYPDREVFARRLGFRDVASANLGSVLEGDVAENLFAWRKKMNEVRFGIKDHK